MTFLVKRRSASGAPLVGYGVASALAVEPPEAARVTPEPRALRHVRLELGDPGRVAIEPASGTALAFDLVAATDVVSVELLPFGEDAPTRAEAGLGVLLVAQARIADGREVLGLGDVLEVESLSPEVCAVERELSAELAATAWPRWSGFDGPFLVTTPKEGVCRLSVRIGGRVFEADVLVEASSEDPARSS